ERLSTDSRLELSSSSRSIMMQTEVEGISGMLTRWAPMQALHRRVIQAFPDTSLAKFLTIAGAMFGAAFLIMTGVTDSFTVGAVAGAIGGYIPFLALSQRRGKRQRLLADQLPEALDFLSRILRAGHSLSTGLQMMAEELPQPLASEFRRAYDEHSLGQPLEECLKNMSTRIESTDFAFFVTAVLIQRQTGGDLSEVLNNISGMIRQRIRLQQHVKAKTAEGRFTGYILSAFPCLMFVIAYTLNPTYAGVLINTPGGRWLLIGAGFLTLMGLFCIKKITTVKV
ncbi:MAG TPA: type II secretion system F family protein, partial [Tepidisphaeraceae bacterium]|nr:type II secretion system F family protein [Tepidisphaeraceae bacterium]